MDQSDPTELISIYLFMNICRLPKKKKKEKTFTVSYNSFTQTQSPIKNRHDTYMSGLFKLSDITNTRGACTIPAASPVSTSQPPRLRITAELSKLSLFKGRFPSPLSLDRSIDRFVSPSSPSSTRLFDR